MPAPQKYSVTGTAGMLEGVMHLPIDAPRAIAVVAHPLPTMGGTMENKVVTTLAKTFVQLGCATLRFNFRGTGKSQGEFDEGDGETEDVLAVTSHARELYGELPLILSGFSFGGYVQARAAELLHPQRLVLVAPAVGRYASSDMPQVPHDTLLIHGDKDEVIPLENILHWARKQHLPIVLLPDATHFFHGRLDQIRKIVLSHFSGHPL
jgi:alpha/beta superfamily hydrolase